jgi:hypothetical protein
MNTMPFQTAVSAAALFLTAVGADAAELAISPVQQNTEWTVSYGGKKVMVYSFAPEKFKPFVKELRTLKGDNILRDSPSDHLHHHALMYGIVVNGINFWEETPGNGVQRVVLNEKPVIGTDKNRPSVAFTQTIHWVSPMDAFLPDTTGAALLLERRTLTLTIDEEKQEVALQWKLAFEAGSKTNQVTLTGANYHGLGMRFLKELDAPASHLNAGGKPDLADRKQDVSKHPWGSVSFDVAGKPATIAIFGAPGNAHGDACFFSMHEPFAYLSATQGLEKEPLVYRSGDKFELNYLIVTYPEVKSSQALQERGKLWKP